MIWILPQTALVTCSFPQSFWQLQTYWMVGSRFTNLHLGFFPDTPAHHSNCSCHLPHESLVQPNWVLATSSEPPLHPWSCFWHTIPLLCLLESIRHGGVQIWPLLRPPPPTAPAVCPTCAVSGPILLCAIHSGVWACYSVLCHYLKLDWQVLLVWVPTRL